VDQERLVGDGWEREHAIDRGRQAHVLALPRGRGEGLGRRMARHLRRLAEQHLHGHVDGLAAERRVAHDEVALLGELADHGERTALARA